MTNARLLTWPQTLLLLLSLAHLGRASPSPPPDLRRLEFSNDHVEWISEAAIDVIRSASHVDEPGHGGVSIDTLRAANPLLLSHVSDKAIEALSTHKLGAGFLDTTETYLTVFTEAVTAPVYPTPNPSAHPELQKMFEKVSATELQNIIRNMSTTYPTRYYKSTVARKASLLVQNFMSNAVGSNQTTLFENTFDQPNVIGRLPGDGSRKEIIVIGGHLDSTSPSASTNAPGADDDASGVAVVLATLRILKESGWKGKYDIEGQGYAGEEAGLLGSQKLAASYKTAGKTLRGMLMLEMVAWQPRLAENQGKSSTITVLSDPVPEMSSHMSKVVSAYVPTAELRSVACGYGCSDHYSYFKQGYPVVCIAAWGPHDSNLNPNYHKITDTHDTLDYERMTDFVKATLAWIVEISS